MTAEPPVLAHLKFTEQGRKRFDEVLQFLDDLENRGQDLAKRARTELVERLLYLDAFGGTVGGDDHRRRFEITLAWDIYPLCFAITWRSLSTATGEYVFSMNGGLVWHGGPGNSGSICLERDVLWSIHS